MEVKEPDLSYNKYSYADYLKWNLDEMVELIKGRVFKMSPAPNRVHQALSWQLSGMLYNYLKGKNCQAFSAPFDVRLPLKSKKNEDIHTVVQPDICVICDLSKLDEAGCIGAPDLIIEILSKGNNQKELKHKYEVYEESGVKEYWIIHPEEQSILIYTLIDGEYKPSRLLTHGDVAHSNVLSGFQFNLTELFSSVS